ncbi:MAG: hypothetical protein CXR30_14740 [Geobacter sp.]|nr:MAG: hypothetical protein CXR30_14740 [Geobacter sp.]
MAAGTIITVLSNIPWDKVVENAPKVTDAAVKLWNMVANRRKQPSDESKQGKASPDTFLSESDLLKARVLALEDGIKCLQDQMEASSELIKALADQNIQLVQRIELNRINLVRYAIATALGGAILLGINIYLFI